MKYATSSLRIITTGETEFNTGITEETYSQLRENNEALTMLTFNTTMYGTLTGVSSSGWVKAASGAISNNSTQMTAMTLVMLSGVAVGNMYSLLASSGAVRVKSSDPFTDGALTGDTFKILHTIKSHSSVHGHDHDGTNSRQVVLGTSQVVTAKIHNLNVTTVKLKTATADSTGLVKPSSQITIAMSSYSFFPKIIGQSGPLTDVILGAQHGSTTNTYAGYLAITANTTMATNRNFRVNWRYITASNNPFQYILRNKNTKEIKVRWRGDDPPAEFFHCTTKPSDFTPPVLLVSSSGGNINSDSSFEEIVCFDYDREHWLNLMRSNTSISKSDVIKTMEYSTKTKRFITKQIARTS